MLDYRTIGKRIRLYRKRCGYTQEELGLSINASGPYISNLERGVKKPSLENLADISEILGVTINELVYPFRTETDSINGLESLLPKYSSANKAKLVSNLQNIINILEQEG